MNLRIFTLGATFLILSVIAVFLPTWIAAQQSDLQVERIGVSVTTTGSGIPLPTERIVIGGVILTVEVAETPTAQQNGLSGRSSLPADHGMLFVFGHEDYWEFWMIDMKFPLDIIWFNSTRQAVFVEPNLPPCTSQNCPVVTPTAKTMFVLEVNAGFVVTHRILRGISFVVLDQ